MMPVQTKTPTLGGAWAARKVFSDQLDLETKLADQILAQAGASASIIADGEIHRLDHPDGRRGNKRVWYVCHYDFAIWGDWGTGEQHSVFLDGPHDPEKAERARQAAEQRKKERRLEQARKHAQAMEKAQAALHQFPWADPLHAYLVNKRIEPFSLRQEGANLVAFMTDGHGVVGYQTISPTGEKRFLAGTPKRGAYWPLGHVKDCITVCEGVGTAIAIHMGFGCAVAAAMDAGNLKPVCLNLRERYPEVPIIVMADNDHGLEGDRSGTDNTGVWTGQEAAEAVKGRCIWPSARPGHKSTDFADLWLESPWYFDREASI